MAFTLILLSYLFPPALEAQTTLNPSVHSSNNSGIITKVELTSSEMIVWVSFAKSSKRHTSSISSYTVAVPTFDWNDNVKYYRTGRLWQDDERKKRLKSRGYLIKGLGNKEFGTYYYSSDKQEPLVFEMHFPRPVPGVQSICIKEVIGTYLQPNGVWKSVGYEWLGVSIRNPAKSDTGMSEDEVKRKVDNNTGDSVVGIYEQVGGNKYKLGIIKDGQTHKVIFLGLCDGYSVDRNSYMGLWQIGDVKCVLERQLQPGLFTGTWGMQIKPLKNKCYVTFEGLGMSVQIENISNGNVELLEKDVYLKTYPTSTGSTMGKEW